MKEKQLTKYAGCLAPIVASIEQPELSGEKWSWADDGDEERQCEI